jgi:hypothetical protein
MLKCYCKRQQTLNFEPDQKLSNFTTFQLYNKKNEKITYPYITTAHSNRVR